MQLKNLIFYNNGVPGVHSTLIANHDICRLTQQICYLAFSFIAPLGTDYNNVSQGFLCMLELAQTFIIPRCRCACQQEDRSI